MSRYVLDANIVLAAFVGTLASPPALLLAGVHNGDLEAVACPLLVDEVRDNLAKPYFRGLLSELDAREALEAYSDLAVMFADPTDVEPVLRDSDRPPSGGPVPMRVLVLVGLACRLWWWSILPRTRRV